MLYSSSETLNSMYFEYMLLVLVQLVPINMIDT